MEEAHARRDDNPILAKETAHSDGGVSIRPYRRREHKERQRPHLTLMLAFFTPIVLGMARNLVIRRVFSICLGVATSFVPLMGNSSTQK